MHRRSTLGRLARVGPFVALVLCGCGGFGVEAIQKGGTSASPARPPAPSPAFEDFTEASRIAFTHDNGAEGKRYLPETMGSGGCALDFDGDARMDLYLVQSGPVPGSASSAPARPNALWRNRGDGTFEDVTATSGAGVTGFGMGAACADYDEDGDTDIYVLSFGPNVLLRNDGGTFTDVTAQAGVADPRWSSSASFLDSDGDGDLDLYVADYLDFTVARHVPCIGAEEIEAYCHPDAYPSAPDVFYRNRGDGTFEDATSAAGLVDATGKGLGVVALDFDDDADTDLYVANDSTPNFLWRNRGDGTFEEIGATAGVALSEDGRTEAGMGVDASDVNADGRLDILVTNLNAEPNSLYLGGARAFRHASRSAGIHAASLPMVGWGCDFLDVDDDGDADLFVANGHVIDNVALKDRLQSHAQPAHLFLNDSHGVFTLVEAASCGAACAPKVGRGTITWDPDDDGRLDLVVMQNGGPARLYRNRAPMASWIGFLVLDPGAARDAIGARVIVEAGGRRQIDERRAGSSYQTSGDPRLHFGLGSAKEVERVTVRWRDGHETSWEHLAAGRYYALTSDGAAPRPMKP